jgi:aspartate-semialdehyde dehydrogenase
MKSVQYALDKMGYPPQPEELLRKFVGPSLMESFTFLFQMPEEQAREAVKAAPGCVLIEDLNGRNYPTPLDTTDQDLVYVGRIRRDLLDDARGLTLWCCGDQVRKGAATNCVQIAELFVK